MAVNVFIVHQLKKKVLKVIPTLVCIVTQRYYLRSSCHLF